MNELQAALALPQAESEAALLRCLEFFGARRVGEGLEVLSRFTDAAEVYIAGASTFGRAPGGPIPIGQLWNNASLALKRAAKESGDAALWARAEACLLNAVRVGGARWWRALELFWANADTARMVPRELPFIFCGLLGIVHHEDGDDERGAGRRNCRQAVRADMNRRRAEVILNNLSLCEDVEALRDAIRACRTHERRAFLAPRGEELHRKPHKAAAEDIRSRIPASDRTYVCEVCNLVSKAKLRACTCKRVLYCSRDCQKAHWKIHREVCTARASRAG